MTLERSTLFQLFRFLSKMAELDGGSQKVQRDDVSLSFTQSPDLRSVLVTSVLNLEKLDVDLYR